MTAEKRCEHLTEGDSQPDKFCAFCVFRVALISITLFVLGGSFLFFHAGLIINARLRLIMEGQNAELPFAATGSELSLFPIDLL